ncbi:MAG TPA: GNAT family N-acetyltransferase, partial [Pyrinomonadaceae bacterium]
MEPSFRVADATDVDTLLAMMRGLYEHERIAFDEAAARAALGQLLADDSCGVAHLILFGAEVAGYLVLTFGFSLEFGGRDAFVDELFVREEFRGRGAGAAALRFAEGL